MKFIKILGKKYEMQDAPVTQGEWKKIMKTNPSYFKGINNPVEQVSWYDIQDFIMKKNKQSKKYNYRLPTEQEWEYCAKSCEKQKILDIAWCYENSDNQTHKVKQKEPNELGLYDMLGNVWEWTSSIMGSYRVVRGGSWSFDARYLRPALRYYYGPGDRYDGFGFRLVRTLNSLYSVTLTLDNELNVLDSFKNNFEKE